MKKALKRSLSLLLAIALIFSSMYVGLSEVDFGGLFAVKAHAASVDDLEFELNDDGSSYRVTYCNSSATGSLAIPETYNGFPVTSISSNAFSHCKGLESIVIPETVTSIGDSAFFECQSLKNIIIPNSVTELGAYAFYSCGELTTVKLSNNLKEIKNHTFLLCSKLPSIDIPEGVMKIGTNAFASCVELISVTIPGSVTNFDKGVFNVSGLSAIYYMGTLEQYQNIDFHEANAELFKAYWHTSFSFDIEDDDELLFVNDGDLSVDERPSNYTFVFSVFDKAHYWTGTAINESGTIDGALKKAYVRYAGSTKPCSDGVFKNEYTMMSSGLSGEFLFRRTGYYDYRIPSVVISNLKEKNRSCLNVYMSEDKKNGAPYISTVFGKESGENSWSHYKELQSNELEIAPDCLYDIIITADLKGESSATYYLSQGNDNKISSTTGVFSKQELYKVFEHGMPVYAYAITSSGKITELIPLNMNVVYYDSVTSVLNTDTVNLLGSDFKKLTIGETIPVIGGAELSLDFAEFPIGFEIQGSRIMISIGRNFFEAQNDNGKTEKDWLDYKEYCEKVNKELCGEKVNEAVDEYKKQKSRWNDGSGTWSDSNSYGLGFDASYFGFIEGYITSSGIVFTEFCGGAAAEFIANYTIATAIGPVPVYLYVAGGGSAFINLSNARPIPDDMVPFTFEATVGITPEVTVGGGVGLKGAISGGIYGDLRLPVAFEFINRHLTLALEGSLGVEGEFLIWKGRIELLHGRIQAVDEYFGSSNKALGGFSKAVYGEIASVISPQYSASTEYEFEEVSRDYAACTSEWLNRTIVDSGVTINQLQTSVYKNSQPQLVKLGDKIMLAYIEDCAERDSLNPYRLVYRIYTPKTNEWTEAKAVYDTGEMDTSPHLAIDDNNNVYVAWQKVKTNPSAATQEELYNAMNSMEIYSAKYDFDTDSFIDITRHTNNTTYDYSPYVTVEGGHAIVYWVNAESLAFSEGGMSIHSSNGSINEAIPESLNYVTALKACGNEVAYSIDTDGNLSTTGDIKFFVKGEQLGEGIVDESAVITNFAYGEFNGKDTLFYTDGSVVYHITDGESVKAFVDNGGITGNLHITNMNGKPAIVYTQATDMGAELCVSTFENNVWSEPVYLTNANSLITNVAVASVGGKVYSVFNNTSTTVISNEETGDESTEYGQTDLRMLTTKGYYELEVSNIGYDEENAEIGKPTPVTVVVENKGTETINNIEFALSDSLGYSKIFVKEVNLNPGAIEGVEIWYIVPENYSARDLTITATIVGCEDYDVTNNTTTTPIGQTDVAIGEISVERIGDVYKIMCDVLNESLIDSEKVVLKASYGESIKRTTISSMTAKSTYKAELLVSRDVLKFDESNLCTVNFEVEADKEINTSNNKNTISVINSEKLVEHKHTFEKQIVESTCKETGCVIYTCSFCGKSYTETLPVLEHSGTWIVEKMPIDNETGVRINVCDMCGDTLETESIVLHGGLLISTAFNTEIIADKNIIKTNCLRCIEIKDILMTSEGFELSVEPSILIGGFRYYGTGSTINITDSSGNVREYTLVVEGDVNGDSIVDALDAMHVGLASNGHRTLDGAYALAADSNADDIVDANDYQAIVNKAVS